MPRTRQRITVCELTKSMLISGCGQICSHTAAGLPCSVRCEYIEEMTFIPTPGSNTRAPHVKKCHHYYWEQHYNFTAQLASQEHGLDNVSQLVGYFIFM